MVDQPLIRKVSRIGRRNWQPLTLTRYATPLYRIQLCSPLEKRLGSTPLPEEWDDWIAVWLDWNSPRHSDLVYEIRLPGKRATKTVHVNRLAPYRGPSPAVYGQEARVWEGGSVTKVAKNLWSFDKVATLQDTPKLDFDSPAAWTLIHPFLFFWIKTSGIARAHSYYKNPKMPRNNQELRVCSGRTLTRKWVLTGSWPRTDLKKFVAIQSQL